MLAVRASPKQLCCAYTAGCSRAAGSCCARGCYWDQYEQRLLGLAGISLAHKAPAEVACCAVHVARELQQLHGTTPPLHALAMALLLQILWKFSIYLESVAILPQLVLLNRTQNIDNLTGNYIFLLG